MKVRPIGVTSIAFSPTSVRSAGTTTGTVTLEAPAAPGSITVTLVSGNAALLQVPASITIPAGSQTGTFTAHAGVAGVTTNLAVKATANAITKSGSVKVLGNGVAVLTLSPTTVKGGTNATATISLDAPAVVNTTVTLSSNASGVARFVDGFGNPITSVVIPVGQKTAQLTVHSYPVAVSKTATLKAAANGLFSTAALTVTP
jgi:hypothetical protein